MTEDNLRLTDESKLADTTILVMNLTMRTKNTKTHMKYGWHHLSELIYGYNIPVKEEEDALAHIFSSHGIQGFQLN